MQSQYAYLHAGISSSINAAAIAVHKEIGPGFLEKIYEEALCIELDRCHLSYQRQLAVPVRYKGKPVGLYRLDLVVERKIVVEIKAVQAIHEEHLAVTLAYLKATGLKVGLVINFGGSIARCRRVFQPAGWDDKEEEKERTAGIEEACDPQMGHLEAGLIQSQHPDDDPGLN